MALPPPRKLPPPPRPIEPPLIDPRPLGSERTEGARADPEGSRSLDELGETERVDADGKLNREELFGENDRIEEPREGNPLPDRSEGLLRGEEGDRSDCGEMFDGRLLRIEGESD